MYSIEEFDRQGMHFFRLKGEGAFVEVCPERGGMITAIHIADEDLLYMNEKTLFDLDKNVRGGIPVLFPIAGQLSGKQYEWEGQVYQMANHGLVRTHSLEVAGQSCGMDHAEITLAFHSTPETRISYPFDFEMQLTYRLAGGKVTILQKATNRSVDSMPICPGFHPYFAIRDKALELETAATTYFDYNGHKEKPLTGKLEMAGLKESVIFEGGSVKAAFHATKDLAIEADEHFRYTVVWVEGDAPFVCIEPWVAKNEALNTKEGLILVKPDKPIVLEVNFYLENKS
nr:aldose epimerase [Heyndrickxia coagulans]